MENFEDMSDKNGLPRDAAEEMIVPLEYFFLVLAVIILLLSIVLELEVTHQNALRFLSLAFVACFAAAKFWLRRKRK